MLNIFVTYITKVGYPQYFKTPFVSVRNRLIIQFINDERD